MVLVRCGMLIVQLGRELLLVPRGGGEVGSSGAVRSVDSTAGQRAAIGD